MNANQNSFLQDMEALRDDAKAAHSMRFFKTGKGQYGEGDVFWGISVPRQHKIATKWYKELELEDFQELMRHPVHEVRLTTLMMLVSSYRKQKDDAGREGIVHLYLGNLEYVNNWDLVDSSAPHILGDWCIRFGWKCLLSMARSEHLWTQRVAIVATQAMIRVRIFEPTLKVAEILVKHPHDLIHKAVGWMLREVGDKDRQTELDWLLPRYKSMPRTMLRYAIEKFPEDLRQAYLKGNA